MAERVIKLPDVGEGVAEAELVEWRVKVGDLVREDEILAAVMTDKATVEIPSPVDGEVVWIGGAIGDTLAVGSPLIRLKTVGEGAPAAGPETKPEAQAGPKAPPLLPKPAAALKSAGAPRPESERPIASPAVRLRAREAGIDLRQVAGTGPAGRIGHADLDAFSAGSGTSRPSAARQNHAVEEIKLVGLRRRIAEKMTLANRVPHITYVEEVDVTALEALRATLNAEPRPERVKLTLLPFLIRAMVKAVAVQPSLNATFDDEVGVLTQYGAVHVGIATQTASGLVVAVVRHAEALELWECAAEVARLAEAARTGSATREELGGSTITITSLGAMGGVATTPILNVPEVAIVGVNKIMTRPHWDGAAFGPRKMMNLSSSFDHRIVDGWNAAIFVQRVKSLLETPAMLFIEG